MESAFTYIGVVRSDFRRLEDCPLQENENAPSAIVEIFSPYLEASKSLCCNSEILLFTWLHQADRSVMVTRPRNDPKNPLVGVFSTRSPDRPNPIGIHRVRIVEIIAPHTLVVSSLEVLDQTPIIDIKPTLD